jgi:hypothetical protein
VARLKFHSSETTTIPPGTAAACVTDLVMVFQGVSATRPGIAIIVNGFGYLIPVRCTVTLLGESWNVKLRIACGASEVDICVHLSAVSDVDRPRVAIQPVDYPVAGFSNGVCAS